ncbi:alkene reductase [Myxococcus sp. AS-1-15]|uniref:alkene reductase n=1 Tax=Myxococcus sp. AS-1-15 TaxID=2874600 RepID=UPI001CBC2608|nr:alkene reductase [Myxococcus sp. AS-1-15]MBZ4399712.1 alkene reductase [Myxococcus sp. AS-1-15]BDT32189.1 alkene reductase [Myxococcus sp. MH1]
MALFTPYGLGRITLSNRVVMAPMSRSRAIGGTPNALMRDYYRQRAEAGLIITEGTSPSPNGLGFAREAGIYSREQVAGWREVTDAVHDAGGHIFVQVMHCGRVGHVLNLPPGARLLAPGVVPAQGDIFTDAQGPRPISTPEAMTSRDVAQVRREFVQAARNAIDAGFDGIELHGANGFLFEQFFNPHLNPRTDAHGGSLENRARLLVEVAHDCAEAIGADRVGVRLSPYNTHVDMPLYDDIHALYTYVAGRLRGLVYVHVVGNSHQALPATVKALRAAFGGALIANRGFTAQSAQAALAAGQAELVAFGSPFIANPDFVTRAREGLPLAEIRKELLHASGAEGYTDYPRGTPSAR